LTRHLALRVTGALAPVNQILLPLKVRARGGRQFCAFTMSWSSDQRCANKPPSPFLQMLTQGSGCERRRVRPHSPPPTTTFRLPIRPVAQKLPRLSAPTLPRRDGRYGRSRLPQTKTQAYVLLSNNSSCIHPLFVPGRTWKKLQKPAERRVASDGKARLGLKAPARARLWRAQA